MIINLIKYSFNPNYHLSYPLFCTAIVQPKRYTEIQACSIILMNSVDQSQSFSQLICLKLFDKRKYIALSCVNLQKKTNKLYNEIL